MRMAVNICLTAKQKMMMIWASGRKNLWYLAEHTRNSLLAAKELTEVKLFHSLKLYPGLNFVDKLHVVLE